MHPLMRPLLITIGTLSVALGVVGMFIPILPTTPFLLLAAACYARSSERFLHWLLNNRWFGTYIRNYREGRGMPRSTKVLTLLALWVTLALSATLATPAWWIRILLLAVGVGVTIHLLGTKTYVAEREPDGGTTIPVPPRAADET